MNRYLRLRHAMIPYLYSMNRRASRENLPLIQPLYYAEPEREEAYNVPDEYYFGTELLVSPITSPMDHTAQAAKAKTWLPEGKWADFFTGTVYEGGRMVDLWRPLANIPVLMKAGAILPMTDDASCSNTVENPAALDVRVFPAANGSFTLWEDQGDTPTDKDENWASTDLAFKGETFTISPAKGNLSVLPKKRSWKITFCSVEKGAVKVTVGGKAIKAEVSYDKDFNRLTVLIPATKVDKEISILFEAPVKIADNRKQRIYEVIERAQMGYVLKEAIWDEINATGKFDDSDLDQNVKGCLEELI